MSGARKNYVTRISFAFFKLEFETVACMLIGIM